MPTEGFPLVVSSGLGIGVVAGVFSGICYIFVQGLRSASTRKAKYGVTNPRQCSVCGAHFFHIPGTDAEKSFEVVEAPEDSRSYVTCSRCHGRACRNTCGYRVQTHWLCLQCIHTHNEDRSWFQDLLITIRPEALKARMSKKQPNPQDGKPREIKAPENEKEEKEVVRDFIERLVGAMLGADLDNTSVARLYKDKEYDAMFDRYHSDVSAALTDLGSALRMSMANLPVSGQTPCNAHASLKNIIKRVLRDAANMAMLKEPQSEAESSEVTTNRTYEDLLATAILNKVIDNYQTELRRPSSGSNSSKKSDTSKRQKKKSKKYSDERWREEDIHDIETTSISSLEEWCRSESSGGSKYVDHMSFTIKQSIEEITTSDEESGSQQYLHSHNLNRNSLQSNQATNADREDWQDNWLFSRKGKSSPKPVPVPMLVPNPSTDYRALIGDKDAEDTSDLSETGSDLEEAASVPDIKTILIDSRTIIGGKNVLENISPDLIEPELQENESEILEEVQNVELTNGAREENERKHDAFQAKIQAVISEPTYEETDSLGSNTEKDAEYTEKYASFPRQISKSKSPIPTPRTSKSSISQEEKQELMESANGLIESAVDDDSVDEPPIVIEGSYSKKEREKWQNPIALAHNPYSKENLDKRLHGHTDNNLFGRDYYIKQAKKAAGGRSQSAGDSSWIERSEHDLHRQKSEPVTNNNYYERSTSSDDNVFKAVPAVIHIDTPVVTELLERREQTSLRENEHITVGIHKEATRPVSLALSTDSDDVEVKRVYNVQTGTIYKIKENDFTKAVIQDSKSPEGTKSILRLQDYTEQSVDEVDAIIDENHNDPPAEPSVEETLFKVNETVMKISALNHLIQPATEIEIKTSPETKVTVNKNATESFILHGKSNGEAEVSSESDNEKNLYQQQVRDVSRKYLDSLVKNVKPVLNKTDIINNYSTPPISLQEYTNDNSDVVNEDINSFDEAYQSCIDLRWKYETLETQQGKSFVKSTPNLSDENFIERNDEDVSVRMKKEDFPDMPSVKDLRKLFDKDKTQTVKRSSSSLTTRPEFYQHQKQVHSLTARSLSKDFRKELQKSDEKLSIPVKEGEVVEKEVEKNDEIKELEEIPPCKSKIAFFECLNK